MKQILKEGLCYFLITCIVFTCCGCRNYYKVDSITLVESATTTVELPDEIVQDMVSIWGDLNWKRGYTKTAYDYTFQLDSGVLLRYVSDLGLFQDYDNNRRAYVSEEQRLSINAMIEQQFAQ